MPCVPNPAASTGSSQGCLNPLNPTGTLTAKAVREKVLLLGGGASTLVKQTSKSLDHQSPERGTKEFLPKRRLETVFVTYRPLCC